jgi:hypothetical protein
MGEWSSNSTYYLALALDGGEWLTSHAPTALSPRKEPRYPMIRRPGGHQSVCGPFGEEVNRLSLQINETRILGHPGCSLVTILTELSRLLKKWNVSYVSTNSKPHFAFH